MPFETLEATQIRGVLPTPPKDACTISRADPPVALRPYVSWTWIARWHLGNDTYEQKTLPYPCANLVADETGVFLYGPTSTCFTKNLTGTGHAVGIKFLPGGARPLICRALADITDRRLPMADFLTNQRMATSVESLISAPPDQLLVALQDVLTLALSPNDHDGPDGSLPDPKIELAGQAVAVISANPQITQVSQLAEMVAMSRRSLQRLFTEYIGLGVKATIKRYRMQEAAEAALSGDTVDWATLAINLGYYDQSHFAGVFTATFGTPPRRLRSRPGAATTQRGLRE